MTKLKDKGFDSLIDARYNHGWDLKNTGFDYNDKLMKRTLSNYMFKNENISEFLQKQLGPIMVFFINKVKYLRIFNNYAVDKNYQKIN